MRCVSLWSFHIFYVYWLTLDPEVDSRPALFWHLLGFTVDASLCVRLRRPYFSVMLGSTVDTSLFVRLRRPYFSVMLGSTVTSLCVRLQRPYFCVTVACTAPVAELTVVSFTVPLNFDHRCHCDCRYLVLFVGCLRRDVVWWWRFFSRRCLRFCLGQRSSDGCWVCCDVLWW